MLLKIGCPEMCCVAVYDSRKLEIKGRQFSLEVKKLFCFKNVSNSFKISHLCEFTVEVF